MGRRVNIFVFYHDTTLPLFKNEIYTPFLTGAANKKQDTSFWSDNSGDNISDKNRNYGELTGQYWVWKNYINDHPEVEYIGFCHYRRFFNFLENKKKFPFEKKSYKSFKTKVFERYTEQEIYDSIKDYDIIVPCPDTDRINGYDRIIKYHPKEAFDKAIQIVKREFPDCINDMETFFNGNKSYICLNFVLKKELFVDWIKWIMKICTELEKEINLNDYNEYYSERIFAYIAERFFNIWILHKIEERNVKVKETDSYLLTHIGAEEYSLFGVKYYKEKSGEKYLNVFDFDIILDYKRVVNWCIKHITGKENLNV